jgi:hypothetical protein
MIAAFVTNTASKDRRTNLKLELGRYVEYLAEVAGGFLRWLGQSIHFKLRFQRNAIAWFDLDKLDNRVNLLSMRSNSPEGDYVLPPGINDDGLIPCNLVTVTVPELSIPDKFVENIRSFYQ